MSDETLTVKFELPPHRGVLAVRSVRRAVSLLCEQWGFGEEDRHAVVLALSEAMSNALEHGSGPTRSIEVGCALGVDGIRIVVEDFGAPSGEGLKKAIESTVAPSDDSVRGRGLYLIRTLMDEVDVKRKPGGGVAVSMFKRSP